MITLDRLEQKIDALTAGMNSVLAAQTRQWEKILDFEKHCADAIRILGDRKLEALSGQIKGLGDGLADEIRKVREDLLAEKLLRPTPRRSGRAKKHGKSA